MADPGDPAAADRRTLRHQQLLAAANLRFREQGYEATTAASIARDAGVTERTFFRHFATKADVLVANWAGYRDTLRGVLGASRKPDVADVVADALRAFLRGVEAEHTAGLDSLVLLYTDRAAFAAITEHVLAVEDDLAEAIGRRTGRPSEDFVVRVASNAALGVMRAAVRSRLSTPSAPTMLVLFDRGIPGLRPVFDALTADGRSG
ncbi:MAG TPA: TetR family transcriptional regulator [Candidatus Nanopelagicales bacterium]|jgi:AcrR family transcriptional regulator|nr:TetR family transcriptional regulator [Candidatus Nanopelagicales bacterium]